MEVNSTHRSLNSRLASPNRSNSPTGSFIRQTLSTKVAADQDSANYTELLLKKEQEIKEIFILKLKKLESENRSKDVLIKDMDDQISTLNQQVLRFESQNKQQKETIHDYETKFSHISQ